MSCKDLLALDSTDRRMTLTKNENIEMNFTLNQPSSQVKKSTSRQPQLTQSPIDMFHLDSRIECSAQQRVSPRHRRARRARALISLLPLLEWNVVTWLDDSSLSAAWRPTQR